MDNYLGPYIILRQSGMPCHSEERFAPSNDLHQHGKCGLDGLGSRVEGLGLRLPGTQTAQYPLIKEYRLNHNMKPYII